MLRFALRRLLWVLPTMFGVSLVVFFLTSLLPTPELTLSAELARDPFAVDRARRERFLDLPMFVNVSPHGVRDRAEACVWHIANDDALAFEAARELTTIGGAAFPYVLPKLDDLPPAQAVRVALALAPIGRRIGRAPAEILDSSERSVQHWRHYWVDNGADFSLPLLRRNVERLSRYGGELRREDLALVDTFALQELIPALLQTRDRRALRDLTLSVQHVVGTGPVVSLDAGDGEVDRVVEYWRGYWFSHQDLHRELDSQSRLLAIVTQTRYAKWVGGALSGQLPRAGTGVVRTRSSVDELLSTLPTTLGLVALALCLACAAALPLGVIGAYRRGRTIDVVLVLVLLALHALPPFSLALLFETWVPRTSIVLPAFALAVGTIGVLSRTQRLAMLEVLGSEFMRTARAKGAGGWRLMLGHALRVASVPLSALAALQIPALFGGAILIEDIFELPGTGRAVLDGIRHGDIGFVVLCVLALGIMTSLLLVGADLAAGLLDPRVREVLRHRGARG